MMKLSVLPRGIKLYRKLRHRKGHGVHSPFAYRIITQVIEEKLPYYVFDEIEHVRRELLTDMTLITYTDYLGKIRRKTIGEITSKECHHQHYGALLFRLVNFFRSSSVLHVGASTGVNSFYLASPRSDCSCIALEKRDDLIEIASVKTKRLGLTNLKFIRSLGSETVEAILKEEKSLFDLIFIDTAYDVQLTKEAILICMRYLQEDSILIVDGIYRNKKMKQLWKEVKQQLNIGITLDLYTLGIVFINNKTFKKDYVTYFNHGKKQKESKKQLRFYSLNRKKKEMQPASKGIQKRRKTAFLHRILAKGN